MSGAPSILVLSSAGCDTTVVTSVLAALQAVGSKLSAFDAGRLGGEKGGAVEWVMRHLSGEIEERRLEREIDSKRPDLVVCFEVGPALVLCELRNKAARPFPVVAVVSDLAPSAAWAQCEVDRYFVCDDEAAVLLEDHGVPGHAIVVVGSIGELRYAQAGATSQEALKKRFGLASRVALVEVDGFGAEKSSQMALQLSLTSADLMYLFAAGADTEAAAALRAQVPVLGIRAKLFGNTEDAPLLWRCADVIVAKPSAQAIARASAVGAAMVCYSPRDGAETRRANALEERGRGAIAANSLMIGPALERMLATSPRDNGLVGMDGAAIVADAAWLLAAQRQEIIDERGQVASAHRRSDVESAEEFAHWAAQASTPAGALEDLGGGGPAPARPDPARLRRLQEEIRERKAQVARAIADAQKQASSWDSKRAQADKLGNREMGKEAERNADMERARMHAALAEMASLDSEERGISEAARAAASVPPMPSAEPTRPDSAASTSGSGTSVHARMSVDEELDRLRRSAGSSSSASAPPRSKTGKKAKKKSGVDDELEALKRKMAQKRK